jgi:hypothetical protein
MKAIAAAAGGASLAVTVVVLCLTIPPLIERRELVRAITEGSEGEKRAAAKTILSRDPAVGISILLQCMSDAWRAKERDNLVSDGSEPPRPVWEMRALEAAIIDLDRSAYMPLLEAILNDDPVTGMLAVQILQQAYGTPRNIVFISPYEIRDSIIVLTVMRDDVLLPSIIRQKASEVLREIGKL